MEHFSRRTELEYGQTRVLVSKELWCCVGGDVNLFVGFIEINFSTNLMAPNLNFTAATSAITLALLHLAEKNLIIL